MFTIKARAYPLVYINTASSRQEGSPAGPWCTRFARAVRAVALQYCGHESRIWCISLPHGTLHVVKCISGVTIGYSST